MKCEEGSRGGRLEEEDRGGWKMLANEAVKMLADEAVKKLQAAPHP